MHRKVMAKLAVYESHTRGQGQGIGIGGGFSVAEKEEYKCNAIEK